MKGIHSFVLTTAAVLTSGCMHMAPATSGPQAYALTAQERELLRGRLHGAERPNVSVALSGGGLRSSLFNFGVLKALYDDGILEKVDIVSSVSGGSYLSYRLFTEQRDHPTTRFGSTIFGNDVFAKSLCEFSAHANFVTWPQMFAYAPLTPVWWSANRRLYEKGLARTFGSADPDVTITLSELEPMVRDHGKPYPIFNATAYGYYHNKNPWPNRAFEFTPLHHGTIGSRVAWSSEQRPAAQNTVAYATLASGAANRVLKRRFDLPYPNSPPGHYLMLWDGGKLDNLGAVAPLLRGTKNLIAIDAQYDGTNEKFGAYYTLQARMANLGEAVFIEDARTERGIYYGRVYGKALDTNLQYVKMEIPIWLQTRMKAMQDRAEFEGKADYEASLKAYETYSAARGDYSDGAWPCAATSEKLDVRDLMLFNVASYDEWVNYPAFLRQAIRRDYWLIGGAVRHDFPETTTVDQSLYMDQALAYIGLGYLNAHERVRLDP